MSFDDCLDKARELKRQGCNNEDILQILMQYCKAASEAERALKELQAEERRRFNSNEF